MRRLLRTDIGVVDQPVAGDSTIERHHVVDPAKRSANSRDTREEVPVIATVERGVEAVDLLHHATPHDCPGRADHAAVGECGANIVSQPAAFRRTGRAIALDAGKVPADHRERRNTGRPT